MPFQITTQPFGTLPSDTAPLTEYVLEHTETGEFITIIPEFGAIMRRMVLRKGRNLFALIQGPESPQALFADESYASALLYPFPSRIRHGIYTFEGEAYALTMNEPQRDCAIHGFVHGRSFTVVSQETTDTHAQLVLRYDYAGDTPGYPFPFALTVTYELIQANKLPVGASANDRMCAFRMNFTAQNTGITRAPAAFGWHPYFMLDPDSVQFSESVDSMRLSLPARTPISLGDDLLPNGFLPYQAADEFSLHERDINSAFLIEPTSDQTFAETILTSGETGVRLTIGQETGPGKLNYVVCYTPPRRDMIAIEPLTANVDAFNNGEGLAILEPADILSGTMWVRLE